MFSWGMRAQPLPFHMPHMGHGGRQNFVTWFGLKGSTKLELRDKFGGLCSRGEHGKQGLNPWKVLCDDNSRCATTAFQRFSWPIQLVDGAAGALWRFGFRLHGVQTAYDRVFWSRGPCLLYLYQCY